MYIELSITHFRVNNCKIIFRSRSFVLRHVRRSACKLKMNDIFL